MQPLVVVCDLQKLRQIGAQCVQIAPLMAAHLFFFECLHERLGLEALS
jgi:hypothetical protein